MQLACQTITYGEGQHERFDEVFAAMAAAGYAGVEIGYRHLQRAGDPGSVKRLLERHNLVLAASHIGGNLEDTTQADAERSVLDDALDGIAALDCSLLLYSGLRYTEAAQFDADLQRLSRAVARCRARGVTLLYHNHDWEFADNGRVIEAIAQTDLRLCPDVGWVAKGGADVPEFLDRFKSRIDALHFKDFAGPAKGVDTVILGEGIAPLRESAAWMRENLPADAWAIAEQDKSDLPPAEAVARNAEFLREVFA